MPYSYGYYKNEIREHFLKNIDIDSKILDVGPGSGTYCKLLSPEYKMDALEIWEPYVEMFKLKDSYQNVIIGDVKNFDMSEYDYIILGDIIEHLSVEDALEVLKSISDKKYLVAVPYLFEQGEEFGNIHETHLQPDLTEEVMIQRYGLNMIYSNDKYGYFINYEI